MKKLVYWTAVFVIALVLVTFLVANRQPVAVWPLPDDLQLRLAYVVLGSLILGFIVGALIAWIGGRRWRQLARDRTRRIAALERELAASVARRDVAPAG